LTQWSSAVPAEHLKESLIFLVETILDKNDLFGN